MCLLVIVSTWITWSMKSQGNHEKQDKYLDNYSIIKNCKKFKFENLIRILMRKSVLVSLNACEKSPVEEVISNLGHNLINCFIL